MTFDNLVEGLCREAHEYGLRIKRTNASDEVTPQDQLLLEQHAKSLLVRWPATPFDPEVNLHDKLLSEAHNNRLREHDNARSRNVRAGAKIIALKDALANHHSPNEPQSHPVLRWSAIVLLAAGLWLGLFDGVHTFVHDAYLAALFALVPAIAFALLVVAKLLDSRSVKSRPWSLAAGISMSAGLVRYAF